MARMRGPDYGSMLRAIYEPKLKRQTAKEEIQLKRDALNESIRHNKEVINENKDKVSILPHGTLTAHHDSVDTLFHTTLNLFPDARIIVPYTTAYNKVHKKPLSKIITPEWIWNTNSHYTNIIKQFLTEEEINGKI